MRFVSAVDAAIDSGLRRGGSGVARTEAAASTSRTEIAALRALGFRKKRIVADLLWESALLVGAGGLLALPLGGLLALYLDEILRQMPGIPMGLHFFAWEPLAAITYVLLLALAGLLAAAYPVYLAARLPIAATMRREIV